MFMLVKSVLFLFCCHLTGVLPTLLDPVYGLLSNEVWVTSSGLYQIHLIAVRDKYRHLASVENITGITATNLNDNVIVHFYSQGKIYQSSEGKTAVLAKVNTPARELSFDWMNQRLYWVDFTTIHVLDVKLQHSAQLYTVQEGGKILGLSLDSRREKRFLFWTERVEEKYHIMRSGLDGSNSISIFNTTSQRPSILLAAPKFSKLLWLDSNENEPTNKVGIYRMSYDGTEVEKIAHQHHYLSSLSLDTHDGVRWYTIDRNGGVLRGVDIPCHIRSCTISTWWHEPVDHPYGQLKNAIVIGDSINMQTGPTQCDAVNCAGVSVPSGRSTTNCTCVTDNVIHHESTTHHPSTHDVSRSTSAITTPTPSTDTTTSTQSTETTTPTRTTKHTTSVSIMSTSDRQVDNHTGYRLAKVSGSGSTDGGFLSCDGCITGVSLSIGVVLVVLLVGIVKHKTVRRVNCKHCLWWSKVDPEMDSTLSVTTGGVV